ncbi:hypothetical protein [Aeromonas phage 59.1]|nr:hypothetical protein [Aeromonas phage 59.1]
MLVDIKLTCEVTFGSIPQGSAFMYITDGMGPAESIYIRGKMDGASYANHGIRLSDGLIEVFANGAKVTPINLKVTNV